MNKLQTSQVNSDPDVINFGIGQPGFDLLPADIMRKAAARRLDGAETSFLNYGLAQGDSFFRQALARFLSDGYDEPVDAAQLFVTAGASNGLDLTCTLFTQAGDVVFAAEPTYFLALRIFKDHGLRVRSVPTDEDGLDLEALSEMLRTERPALLYTIPTFQNPGGMTLPVARRQRLAELAAAYDFLVVADEVYHLLRYTITPPVPMAHFISNATSGSERDADGNDHIISLGSFSKILAPGLRLGWIQAGEHVIQRFATCGLVDSGGGLNPFTSALVRTVLEKGWQAAYLEQLRRTYAHRIEVMDAALCDQLGGLISYTRPAGGFFFWLTLPAHMDGEQLLDAAAEYKVGFQPGSRFSSHRGLRNHIRLSFAFYGEEDIREGVQRLAQLLGEFRC